MRVSVFRSARRDRAYRFRARGSAGNRSHESDHRAQEKCLPVFGIAPPAIVPRGAGRGRGAAADPAAPPPPPPPPIVLGDVAKETVAYTRADYLFTSGTSDTFLRYIEEIKKAGGSMRTHPFAAKIGIWHRNPENVNAAIVRQLNAGHANISMRKSVRQKCRRDQATFCLAAHASATGPGERRRI